MLSLLSNVWALLLGLMLLMVGNGLQGTLLGVRGALEGFSTLEMSVVMSAYFVGFLGGSWMAPGMIRRVGHVRVFAALGSFISAVLILFPVLTEPWAWTIGRVIIGFCYSGVYVVAESWLNNAATNETRGQALSAYMITMMFGIVAAQGIMLVADPSGFILFVIPSVLVSISFAPILLSINPTPVVESSQPMTMGEVLKISPLGAVGMFLLGGVYAAQYGMAAVYGAKAGLSLVQISIFVATFYVGATLTQFPLGWLSDRMDRRLLILLVAAVGGVASVMALILGGYYPLLLVSAFLIGGTANPLYSLLIAYTNDFLEPKDMASASSGLVFVNGVGAIAGPLITGWVMNTVGTQGYFLLIGVLLLGLAGYAGYRMTQRPSPRHDDSMHYAPVSPSASPMAVEIAQEFAIDAQDGAEVGATNTEYDQKS